MIEKKLQEKNMPDTYRYGDIQNSEVNIFNNCSGGNNKRLRKKWIKLLFDDKYGVCFPIIPEKNILENNDAEKNIENLLETESKNNNGTNNQAWLIETESKNNNGTNNQLWLIKKSETDDECEREKWLVFRNNGDKSKNRSFLGVFERVKREHEKDLYKIYKRITEEFNLKEFDSPYYKVKKRLNSRESVEDINSEKTKKLKWDYTDVLYSFRGIYSIGILAYDKDSKCKLVGKEIKSKDKDNKLYSDEFLNTWCNKNQDSSLHNEMIEFIENYNSIGNLIPIWPGGNVHKGHSQCYDLASIYFNRHEKWFNHLLNEYPNAEMEYLKTEIPQEEDLINFLENINEENFNAWLKRINEIIKAREILLNARIIKFECNPDKEKKTENLK